MCIQASQDSAFVHFPWREIPMRVFPLPQGSIKFVVAHNLADLGEEGHCEEKSTDVQNQKAALRI